MINRLKKNLKVKYLLLFFIILCFAFCFTCFCLPLQGDEIWNYGFSYNISRGMVIYKDFNVLQMPLYFFVGSIFIHLFGNYLISLHILDSIIITIMFFILFKMLHWKVLIIYPFILLMAIPSYNLLCVFFLFLILYLVSENKDNDLIIGFIVSLLFLTKQNVGICLFLVYLLNSKSKVKSLAVFLIPIFIMFIYLILTDAFYSFFDYCFLGMFDFAEKNNHFVDMILCFLEVAIVGYLIYKIIRSGFKDKSLYYIFSFQIMLYPIVDVYHFLICFVPVLFLLVKDIEIDFRINIVLSIIFVFLFASIPDISEINFQNNFLYLRSNLDISSLEKAYLDYEKDYDYKFFCFTNAYLYKLYMNVSINKYDLMLNGNMGYRGAEKYIKEIDYMCKKNPCVFFVDEHMHNFYNTQFSKEIFYYIVHSYTRVETFENFSIYTN